MEAAITRRVREVRKPASYLGFLEWVAWGALYKRQVLMLFGNQEWDIMPLFAPQHPPIEYVGVCRVGAVRLEAGGKLLSAGLASSATIDVNHFVIGVASGSAREATYALESSSCARRAAMQAGWLLKETVCQGDCALDAMAYHLGLERSEPTWTELRHAIADFLEGRAGDKLWQNIAVVCQEGHRDAVQGGLGSKPQPMLPASFSAGLVADLVADGFLDAGWLADSAVVLLASGDSLGDSELAGNPDPTALGDLDLAPLPPPPFPPTTEPRAAAEGERALVSVDPEATSSLVFPRKEHMRWHCRHLWLARPRLICAAVKALRVGCAALRPHPSRTLPRRQRGGWRNFASGRWGKDQLGQRKRPKLRRDRKGSTLNSGTLNDSQKAPSTLSG